MMTAPLSSASGVNRLSVLLALLAVMTLGGCVTQPLPAYQISLVNQVALSKLRPGTSYGITSVNAALHAEASVRAYSAIEPQGGWSAFLADGLKQELIAAQHFDKDSNNNIEVTVVTLQLKDGTARLAARFVVRQAGVISYDKVLEVNNTWKSSFFGPMAVQDAVAQFGAIFQQLQRKLFDDEDFIRLV